MGTGFAKMMKQLKKIRDNLVNIEDELKDKVFEGSAGGGAVKVTADGAGKLVSIKIDPDVVKSGDVEMLQDLVLAAVNQAQDRASEYHTNELKKAAGEIGLPGILRPGPGD